MRWYSFETHRMYDSLHEMDAAEARFENNELIKEQIEQNIREQEKNRELTEKLHEEMIEAQREIEYDKMQAASDLEASRQEHELEMRLLNICDNAGINKELFETFISNLANSEEYCELLVAKANYSDDLSDLYQIDYELDALQFKNSNTLTNENDSKSKEKNDIKLLRTFLESNSMNISSIRNIENVRIKELIKEYDNHKYGLIKYTVISVIVLIGLLFLLPKNIIVLIASMIVAIILISIKAKKYIDYNGSFIDKCLNEYDKIDSKVTKLEGKTNELGTVQNNIDDIKEKISKEEFELNDIIDDLEKQMDKLRSKNEEKNLKEFYDFRVNHFNSQIEKLLLDFEFEKRFGDNFKPISSSDVKKNGEVSDYFMYFNESKINGNKLMKSAIKEIKKEPNEVVEEAKDLLKNNKVK